MYHYCNVFTKLEIRKLKKKIVIYHIITKNVDRSLDERIKLDIIIAKKNHLESYKHRIFR